MFIKLEQLKLEILISLLRSVYDGSLAMNGFDFSLLYGELSKRLGADGLKAVENLINSSN